MSSRHESRGLTLLELCFGLAVVAVLAGMSVPGFRQSLRAAAVRSASVELLAGLQHARATAILESRTGGLCPLDAAGRCQSAGTPASAWGWFLEAGADRPSQSPQVQSRQTLSRQALPRGITLRATRSPLHFHAHSHSASPGTLTICDTEGIATPRSLVVSLSGRARVEHARPEACA
jgi:type IV fimbrial biogenesis protein FimT